MLIWTFGLFYIIDSLNQFVPNLNYLQTTNLIREVIAIVAFVWFLLRYIKLFETKLVSLPAEKPRRMDKATTFAVGKLMRVIVAAITFLIRKFNQAYKQ